MLYKYDEARTGLTRRSEEKQKLTNAKQPGTRQTTWRLIADDETGGCVGREDH